MTSPNFSYDDMIRITLAHYAHYTSTDEIRFSEFDGLLFNPSFKMEWYSAIQAALATKSDETIVDEGTTKTISIDMLMRDARDHYADCKYFIERAFPTQKMNISAVQKQYNLSIQASFGLDNYKDASTQPRTMVFFLEQFYKKIVEHNAALNAVGIPPHYKGKTLSIRESLFDAITYQGEALGTRGIETQNRREVFAVMFEYTRDVCRAAKRVFKDNEAKLKIYRMYVTNSTKSPKSSVVPMKSEGVILEGVTVETIVVIKNTGEANFTVFVTNALNNPVPTTAILIKVGEEKTVAAEAISDGSFGLLVLSNPSSLPAKYILSELELSEEE